MDSSLTTLLAFFDAQRAAARSLVLATVISTEGSTYRKPGARMLIDGGGEACGLLSGGCLESDLAEHARTVLTSGSAHLVEYDLRSSDDLVWGLGLGCEGAMTILLQRVSPADGYAPLAQIGRAHAERLPFTFATVVRSDTTAWPAGRVVLPDAGIDEPIGVALERARRDIEERKGVPGLVEVQAGGSTVNAFIDSIELPPRILILGAGPDAAPVVEAACVLGWSVAVFDHRPAYAVPIHFPRAERVVTAAADELHRAVDLEQFEAAVIMSHHLPSDLSYLRQLAATDVPYIGLLGPASRRQRLLAEAGNMAASLSVRLFGPVGLDIGARTPESIALAIVAEIHAVLSRRGGQPFSRHK
jgi:xanthine/CO dehydrogenase XdhC/CoxF family maturation factor